MFYSYKNASSSLYYYLSSGDTTSTYISNECKLQKNDSYIVNSINNDFPRITRHINSQQSDLNNKLFQKGYKNNLNDKYLIDMDKMISENTSAKKYYKDNLNDMFRYIVNNCSNLQANSGKCKALSSQGLTVIDNTSSSKDDWDYCVGKANGDLKCIVRKYTLGEPYYSVIVNYTIQDVYCWPSNRNFNLGSLSINESKLAALQKNNMAKDFKIFGAHINTIDIWPNSRKTIEYDAETDTSNVWYF